MTSTEPSPPATGADPATTPSGPPARTSTHGRGNWRSLVISMVIMTVVVFVLVALMPHPAQRERTTVDVARVAGQLAAEKHWPLATVRTGDDWHPTSVRLAADDKGVPTWEVGYHHLPGDDRYVVLSQTRPGDGVSAEQVATWVSRQSRAGRDDGTSQVGGVTWTRRTAAVEGGPPRTQRSLVAQGADAPGGLTTVLSGEVDYADLERFAGSLQLQDATAAATPSAAQTSSR
ncbi:MAG: DUF4245 domain-containing protein [Austwickia sp.]|nr:MAG: DUF4245 domain-containing protein [Austwickia sp.]